MMADKSDATSKQYHPVASPNAVVKISEMMFKIGADKELPNNEKRKAYYLSEFWVDMYLKNHSVPDDIPFNIIISEFTTALVQGKAERKGNNQAAICQAFNNWISKDNVVHNLYQVRDRMYPKNKPKQIADEGFRVRVTGRPDDCFDWPPEEVKEYYEKFKALSNNWQATIDKGGRAAKLERTKQFLIENGEWEKDETT